MISRRQFIGGLAGLVLGSNAISANAWPRRQSQPNPQTNSQHPQPQFKKEDIMPTAEEFYASLKDKTNQNYAKKIQLAYDNPESAISFFNKDQRRIYEAISGYYYPEQKVHSSIGQAIASGIGEAFGGNTDFFQLYVSKSIVIEEELGIKLNYKRPDKSDLVTMSIMASDYSEHLLWQKNLDDNIIEIFHRLHKKASSIKKQDYSLK